MLTIDVICNAAQYGLTAKALPEIEDERTGEDNTGWVYSSELFSCPIRNRFRRQTIEEQRAQAAFPDLVQEGLPERSMQAAERGRWLQRALKGYLGQMVRPEVPVRQEEWKVRGRIDILIGRDVVEIKGRTASKHSISISHVFQTLSYMLMVGSPTGQIITVIDAEKVADRYELWTLKPDAGGWYVTDSKDKMWKSPYNSPAFISENTLMKEIQRQRDLLAAYDLYPNPFSSDARDYGAWCYSWEKFPPARNGSATAIAACPVGCFGEREMTVESVDGKLSAQLF